MTTPPAGLPGETITPTTADLDALRSEIVAGFVAPNGTTLGKYLTAEQLRAYSDELARRGSLDEERLARALDATEDANLAAGSYVGIDLRMSDLAVAVAAEYRRLTATAASDAPASALGEDD